MKNKGNKHNKELAAEWKRGLSTDQFDQVSSLLTDLEDVGVTDFKMNQVLDLEKISKLSDKTSYFAFKPAYALGSVLVLCLLMVGYFSFSPQTNSQLASHSEVDFSSFTDDYYAYENVFDDDILLLGELL